MASPRLPVYCWSCGWRGRRVRPYCECEWACGGHPPFCPHCFTTLSWFKKERVRAADGAGCDLACDYDDL